MSIQTFIQDEILLPRLRRNGVLVLYDPEQLDPDRLDLSRRSEPPPPRLVRLTGTS